VESELAPELDSGDYDEAADGEERAGAGHPAPRLCLVLPLARRHPTPRAQRRRTQKRGAQDRGAAEPVHCADRGEPAWGGLGTGQRVNLLTSQQNREEDPGTREPIPLDSRAL